MTTAYERVQAARQKGRPTASFYVEHLFTGFLEMHGDRRFADDPAIVAGIARLNGLPVTVIGAQDIDAQTLRLDLGVTWYPMPGR